MGFIDGLLCDIPSLCPMQAKQEKVTQERKAQREQYYLPPTEHTSSTASSQHLEREFVAVACRSEAGK